jgi:hypothetical protein
VPWQSKNSTLAIFTSKARGGLIHLENNILFPRAVEMESQAQPEWQSLAGEHQCFKH